MRKPSWKEILSLVNLGKFSSAKAPSRHMREAIVKLQGYVDEMKKNKGQVKDGNGLEGCCKELESYMARTVGHARTNEGTQSFKWLLRDKYGASEEDMAKFLDTLFWEHGVDAAGRGGISKATNHDAFRREWQKLDRLMDKPDKPDKP